ncbi:hypothetical protein [Bacteroides sp. UBA939]|uniref:hypothetical protein n=1 Tax=Bacteroides sp. UBA939 TaxID=1946092 RepID=UPI0025BC1FCD|nr:hypothetical protein [Bacteroides sp. UBA939]
MKKFILLFLLCISIMPCYAQEGQEPEFVGEVNLINGDQVLPLDKEFITIKTKASASMYIVGVGNIKTKINVEGNAASVRASQDGDFKLVVRAVDNNSDPLSIISIFQFETSKKKRTAELSSLATFGGQTDNKLKQLGFSAKKFGESSYLITLKEKPAGEIGVIVKNPNTKDEKSIIVSCFGIDK